jgi:Leucine-rich repeat (LRR) protein
LSKIEKLTLPWVENEEEEDILEIGTIDKNAFVELTNLTCLHLNIQQKLQPLTYDKLDFKNLINLKELCLERTLYDFDFIYTPIYLDLCPPPNLEKLTVVNFDVKLNTLTHLKNLNFLRLYEVQTLSLNDSKALLDFKNLKHLDFGSTNLVFDCINRPSLHMGPKSLEVLNLELVLEMDNGYRNEQQPKIFFENLPNLKRLLVLVESLEEIDIVSLKKLSWLEDLRLDVEECNNDRELIDILGNFSKLKKLSVKGLSSVDRDFIKKFPNLESLILWGKLRDIQSGSFDSLPNLTALDLRSNKLENLEVDLFKSLNKLLSLDLSLNPLKRISSKLFAKLGALNVLNLVGCEILYLEPNTFHGLDNLNILTLRSNKLTHLNEASFKGLKNLTQLDLSANKLTEINEEIFGDTCYLSKLELNCNQLIDIRFGLNNQSLKQLKCLNLSDNKLEKFEVNLRNLEDLDLSFNETLTRLRPGAFKNLSKLKRLHLDFCSLKVVDAKTFEGLCSLEHLNLAENCLEDIGVGTFDLMKNLKELNISKNRSLLNKLSEFYNLTLNIKDTMAKNLMKN